MMRPPTAVGGRAGGPGAMEPPSTCRSWMAVHQAATRRFQSRSRIFVPRVWPAGADVSCARVSFTQPCD